MQEVQVCWSLSVTLKTYEPVQVPILRHYRLTHKI